MGNYFENHHRSSHGNSRGVWNNGMRRITTLVIHCTATRADIDFTQKDLLRSHRARGMKMIGYHFFIRKDGYIWSTRPLDMVGAHALGHNQDSIGIAYEGGLDARGQPADTRTQQQKHSLRALIRTLRKDFPITKVCGHRDLSPDRNGNGVVESHEWLKQCPCFDVATDEWCK